MIFQKSFLKRGINRRGQIAIIILPLIAVLFMVSCLIIFAKFDGGFRANSNSISALMSESELGYDYIISEAETIAKNATQSAGNGNALELTAAFMNAASKRDFGYYFGGNLFKKIRDKDFIFVKSGAGYDLKINGLFFDIVLGENEVYYNFNMELKFNSAGDLTERKIIGL